MAPHPTESRVDGKKDEKKSGQNLNSSTLEDLTVYRKVYTSVDGLIIFVIFRMSLNLRAIQGAAATDPH